MSARRVKPTPPEAAHRGFLAIILKQLNVEMMLYISTVISEVSIHCCRYIEQSAIIVFVAPFPESHACSPKDAILNARTFH